MTVDIRNPFHGRTLRAARPSAADAGYRLLAERDLSAAQVHWDAAEDARRIEAADTLSRMELLTRYETREEPAEKAHENRKRIAFLSAKGATMKMWLEHLEAIQPEH